MEDILYFQDDAGNEIGLIMVGNFEFEGKNYAIFQQPQDDEGGIYVMRMDSEGEELSFHMPDDDEMEKLMPFLMEMLEQHEGGCSGDCCSCHGCHGHDEEDLDADEEDLEFPGN